MSSSTPHSRQLLGIGCGIAAGAVWGGVFLAPELMQGHSPFELSAARYLVYGLISVALILPRWNRLKGLVTRADWLALARLSLAGNLLYYVFLALAVQLGGVAIASFIVGLIPVAVTLIGSRDEGALRLRTLLGPLLLVGVGIVAMNADLFSHSTADADVLAKAGAVLAAALALASWTYYAVANSRWLARVPHFSNQDWSLLTGLVTGAEAVLLLPVFLFGAAHTGADWAWFWFLNLLLAFGASVVGNALWNAASRLLPLTLSGQMILFETLFALLYGFLWEGRGPRPLEIVAIAALVAGVAWSARLHRPAH